MKKLLFFVGSNNLNSVNNSLIIITIHLLTGFSVKFRDKLSSLRSVNSEKFGQFVPELTSKPINKIIILS